MNKRWLRYQNKFPQECRNPKHGTITHKSKDEKQKKGKFSKARWLSFFHMWDIGLISLLHFALNQGAIFSGQRHKISLEKHTFQLRKGKGRK